MIKPETLRDVDFWRTKLGLLLVPLFRDTDNTPPFVALNGPRGNFCVDFGAYDLSEATRNFSWSANVGHYVSFTEAAVEVQRWDQRQGVIERYSYANVVNNLEQFHAHLEKDPPKHELSVVAHAIRVFRSLRATLGPEFTGADSLRAFLYLLASATDGGYRGQIHLPKWHLSPNSEEVVSAIPSGRWDTLHQELIRGRPHESLAPDLGLVLRHASGQVFQEAHYEALFFEQSQLLFDGFMPRPVSVGTNTASIGLHFTPPALARTVVEETLKHSRPLPSELTVFDPACGSGEFLREALRQLKLLGFSGKVVLIGWDISQAACEMAEFVLAWEARDATAEVEMVIQCADSLSPEAIWPHDVDWVLMNPPFVAWQDLTSGQRNQVREVLGHLHYQRADLSHAFIWRAAQSLREGGILGSIAPASLLDSDSAARVRTALAELLQARLLARLGNHALFMSATVDAAVYVAQRSQSNDRLAPVAFWADHRVSSNAAGLRSLRKLRSESFPTDYPVLGEGFSIYLDPDLGQPDRAWAPRPYESWSIGRNLAGLPRVANLFDVKQGIRTGHNGAFLISRNQFHLLPERERKYFRPAVVNKSIKFGYLSDVEYVFYPYAELRLGSEEELREQLPDFSGKYLLPAKTKLLTRPRVQPNRWWELSEHRAWQLKPEPKIVSTYFGGAGSFAWDDSGAFAVVQGFAWIPRKRATFNREIGLAYIATLNSRFFETLLGGVSNHVSGGQWNLSKKFIEQIAIPNYFEDVSASLLSSLSLIGGRIHAGLPIDDAQLESLIREIYGADRTA